MNEDDAPQDVRDALEFTRLYIGHAGKHLATLAREVRAGWQVERELRKKIPCDPDCSALIGGQHSGDCTHKVAK